MDSTRSPQLVQTGPERFEAGLIYRYLQPDGPGPYPTVVLLHGRFGDEDVMWLFRRVIPRPWLVFAPRAPLAEPGGGFSWHTQPYGEWPELVAFDPAVAALTRFLEALPRLYNADPDRLYPIGFSQGAAVAYATALNRPGITRAIAGLVGFVPRARPEAIAGRLNGLPVFMAVGEQDPIVPYAEAQRSAEALRHAGVDLEYHEYPAEHKMTAAGLDDLQAWLHAQR